VETRQHSLLPLRLETQWHERVWGGDRLARRQGTVPIGEAWIVHEANKIIAGPLTGKTLAEATATLGWDLLGEAARVRDDARFPLLIKLIDTAEWLSIQVHPDDFAARELEGPLERGKTEAWYILDAGPESEIVAGVRSDVDDASLARAIHESTIEEVVLRHAVAADDFVYIPAGTIHALGPSLMIYEVQQSSDLTYRVYDWSRPATAGRALHIDKSARVARATNELVIGSASELADGDVGTLLDTDFFVLRQVAAAAKDVVLDPNGVSFQAVTASQGQFTVEGHGWNEALEIWQTIVIPATAGPYRLVPHEPSRALISSLA
jgi:mannose-6-phosphate isomerase